MYLKTCLLVASLVAVTSAGPTGSHNFECASKCNQSNKFFYEIGRRYIYGYQAETNVTLNNSDSNDATSIKVTASVTIQPITPCEHVLSVSEVKLHGSDQSETFAKEVEKHSIRFTFQNGRVEHVCPAQDDSQWAVNFKKGILSNLQNSMTTFEDNEEVTETDISGTCKTSYELIPMKGLELFIKKKKTPSDCTHQPKIHQKLTTFGYTLDSLVQELPIVSSTQECIQVIQSDIFGSIECTETHKVSPFTGTLTETEARTVTTLVLNEILTSTTPMIEFFNTRKELLFEHPQLEIDNSALIAARDILTQMSTIMQDSGIKKEVPALFSEFVTILRRLTKTQMQVLYDESNLTAKKIVLDGLPVAGTPESMGMFVDLIQEDKVSEKERDVWYSSFAFIKNPSLEMFSAVEPLLKDVKENKALLGISSMIHNYCEKEKNCELIPVISSLIRNIESRLGISCRVTSAEDKLNIMYALKALGNVGHFINAGSVLRRCYLEDNPMEIRVAAIDAWRRTPCDEQDQPHLLATFTDETQDNEIRIAAYLALMKCPTQEVVDILKDRLTSESVNQVATFVWTHLSNIQESAAPEKQWVRHLIGEELLQNKFKSESLKLSRNFESSFYLKDREFGANAESNVIFSGKSFIPRSSMFNFTIDLFGKSLNLFEVGGRIEGLESYIEKFFGPEGYYPEETIQGIIKNLRKGEMNEPTSLDDYFLKEKDVPKGSLYLKLLGNELFYKHFEDLENAVPEMAFSNIFDAIMELASKGSINYSKNYNLINSEFTFPTISGFPINLKLDGVASVALKLDGNFNFNDLSSINIEGILHPSAAVKMDSSMIVDAFVTKSGLKVTSTMHSSTSVSGKAIIDKGKIIDLTINTPEEKTEIYDFSHEVIQINNGIEHKKLPDSTDSLYECNPLICKYLGMDLCFEVDGRYGTDYSYNSKIYLQKTDTHSAYVFHYSNTPEKMLFTLDMPESSTDKKWSASLEKDDREYELDLHTPRGSVEGKLSYINNYHELGLEVEVGVNGKNTYGAKFYTNREKGLKGEIGIEYKANEIDMLKFEGELEYATESKLLEAEFELKGELLSDEIKAKLNINGEPEKSLTLDVQSKTFEMSIKGGLNNLSTEKEVALKGTYRLFDRPPKSFTANVHYENQVSGDKIKTFTTVDIEDLNFNTDFSLEFEPSQFKTKINGRYNHIKWDISQSFSRVWTDTVWDIKSESDIQITPYISAYYSKRFYYSKDKVLAELDNTNDDSKLSAKFIWNFDEDLLIAYNLQINSLSILNMKNYLKITKLSPGSYSWTGHQNKDQFDGFFKYDSSENRPFYMELEHKSKNYDLSSTTTLTQRDLTSDTTFRMMDETSSLEFYASKTAIRIKNTFKYPLNAEAKIETEGVKKTFLFTLKLGQTDFKVSGSFSPEGFDGILKYKEQKIKLLARLDDKDIHLEIEFPPQKRFAFWVKMEPGKLALGAETPFFSWEKQEATLTYSYNPKTRSFKGQGKATMGEMSLTFDFSDDSDTKTTKQNLSVTFKSSFKAVKNVELTAERFVSRRMINMNIKGTLNNKVLKASVDALKKDYGFTFDANLKTPFTKDLSASSKFEITDGVIFSSLGGAYGSEKIHIVLKGDFSNSKHFTGSLVCTSTILPEVNLTSSIRTTGKARTIEIKGKVDNKKVLFYGNCENYMADGKHVCKCNVNMVHDSFKIVVFDLTSQMKSWNEFEINGEISSDFIGQSLKGLIEGQFKSISLVTLSGYISAFKSHGKINVNHRIENSELQTDINVEIDSRKMALSLRGNVDLNQKTGSLHGNIKSFWPCLDGYEILLKHTVEGTTRNTNINFSKNEFSITGHHSLTIEDSQNWMTTLTLNDKYSASHEMRTADDFMKHITKVTWPDETASSVLHIDYKDNLKVNATIETPWTSLIDAHFEHTKEESKIHNFLNVKYGINKKLQLQSSYVFDRQARYAMLSIINEDWNLNPLKFEVNVKTTVGQKLDFTVHFNQVIVATLQLFKKDDTHGANLKIKLHSNDNHVTLTGKYTKYSDKISMFLEYEGDQKYFTNLTLSGGEKSGNVLLEVSAPFISKVPLTATMKYELTDYVKHVTFDYIKGDEKNRLEILLDMKSFTMSVKSPLTKGSLKVQWQNDEKSKFLRVDFKSPISIIKDTFFKMNFVTNISKKLGVNVIYGQHNMDLDAELKEKSFEITSNSTISGWENLQASGEFDGSSISGVLSRNNERVTFSGEVALSEMEGEGKLHFSLPITELKENVISFKYINKKEMASVDINAHVGSEIFNFYVNSEQIEEIQTKVTMKVKCPFQNILIEALINDSSIKVNGQGNEVVFDSLLKFISKDLYKKNMVFTFNSNIPGWAPYSVEVDMNLVQKPYTVIFELKEEDTIKTFSVSLNLTKDTFDLTINTPYDYIQKVDFTGNYEYQPRKLVFDFESSYFQLKANGHIDISDSLPFIKIHVISKLFPLEVIINVPLKNKRELHFLFNQGQYNFEANLSSTMSLTSGNTYIELSFMDVIDLNVDVSFDITGKSRFLSIKKIQDGIEEKFYVGAEFDSNKFEVDIKTPIENYEKFTIAGQYDKNGNEYDVSGKLYHNHSTYKLDGSVVERDDGYEFIADISFNQLSKHVQGVILKDRTSVKYNIGGEQKEILIKYLISPTDSYIKMNTPFEQFSYLAMGGRFDNSFETTSAMIYVHRNDDHLEVKGFAEVSPLKCNMKLMSSTNHSIQLFYNLHSPQKEIGVILEREENIIKYVIEALYEGNQHGYVKIHTSVPGFKLNVFEYKFKVNSMTDTEAFLTVIRDLKERTFGIKSKINANEFTLMVKTPFDFYESIGIESQANVANRQGKIKVQFGPYNFFFEGSFQLNDFNIHTEIDSFGILKVFKISSKYEWNSLQKSVFAELLYNDIKYEIEGDLVHSSRTPQFNFKFTSPIEAAKIIEVTGKLDLITPLDLFEIGLKLNSIKYYLSFGYELEDLRGAVKIHMVTPLEGWSSLKVSANVDMVEETKTLNMSFEKENIIKTIILSAKMVNGEVDFDLQTPFETLGNLNTRGSFSRSKRSIEFQMMNDDHRGGLIASFNSLKITAKTPFEKAKDISFELTKSKKGGWSLHYKRNANQVFFNFDMERKKKGGFSIKIDSEIPGWEVLALAGRIDLEEAIAHIRGQRNAEILKITGNGNLGGKTGGVTIKMVSPYEKYREVNTKLQYNTKRNIVTFESKSKSSDFHILLEYKKGLTIEVFVPHPQENTVAKGKLTIFNGSLTISSRFPAIRTFSMKYNLSLGAIIKSTILIERNGVKIFDFEFERDGNANTAHLKFDARRGSNHSMLHFHREGWKMLMFSFNRNGKELKIDVNGTGNLPMSGTVTYTISNSFREVPRTLSGSLEVDRTSAPKKLTLTHQRHNGMVYIFHLTYNINLKNLRKGDFTLRTTTPQRNFAPWKDISGKWETDGKGQIEVVLKVGPRQHTLTGNARNAKGDLVFETTVFPGKKFIAQWDLDKKGNDRDYFVKIGQPDKFLMVKLKGTFDSISFGDVSGAIQLSRFMEYELQFTAKWNRTQQGLSGSGTFKMGRYSGTHKLVNIKRDPVSRAATFHWEATSNIPHINKVILIGEYNLSKRLIDFKLSWDSDEISMKGSLENVSPQFSENTIQFHIPQLGDGQITFSHDFRNPLAKSAKAVGNVGPHKLSYIFSWTRNKNLTVFDFNGDIDSFLFGKAHIKADFDITNLADAKGNLNYTRNNDKSVSIKWSRVKTKTNLKDELEFKSHFRFLPSARIYVTADWSRGFILDSGIEWASKAIKGHLEITPNKTTATIETPFERFGNVNVNIDYDLKKKNHKTIKFQYTRGGNVINMDFDVKTEGKKTGTLTLNFSSPFEILKTLTMNANWKKGNFHAVYQRNDVTVNFDGKAEVKADKSSFHLKFNPPNRGPVELEFSYDLQSFVKGSGKSPKGLIDFKLHIDQHQVNFHVKGFRASEHLLLEVEGNSSFNIFKSFHIKLDSELNLNNREGHLKVHVDDKHFEMHNTFERRPKGFYARSQMDSNMTPLPGLILGFGRDRDSIIATLGYGKEREIRFTFKGKDHFKKGFAGTIDIPRKGIHGLDFSVNYNFKSEDKLEVAIKIKVDEGQFIDANIVYNSDGVRTRLASPWTGDHRARARRSISDNHFMADIGVDDYGFTLDGYYDKDSFKKGYKIEGEILGHKVFVGGFLNLNSISDSAGKLIIQTPFRNFKNVGGEFKLKSSNGKFNADLDLNVIYHISAKVDLDFERKLKGYTELTVENLVYNIKYDFKPNDSENSLNGKLVIQTPHQLVQEVELEGIIKTMNSKTFEASFKVNHPTYPYNLDVMLNSDAPVYSLDVTIKTPNDNTFRVVADYSLITPFNLKGNTSVYSNSKLVFNSNSELSYKSANDMYVNYEVVCSERSLQGIVNLDIKPDLIKGELTGIIMNFHTFKVKLDIPTHWKKALIEVTYEGNERYAFIFDMERSVSMKKYILDVETPYSQRGSVELLVYHKPKATFKAMIQNSKGVISTFNVFAQKAMVNGDSHDKLVNEIEFFLPYYMTTPVKSYMELSHTHSKLEGTLKVNFGRGDWVFYGKYNNHHKMHEVHLNFDNSTEKSTVYVIYDRTDNFKLTIESIILGYINNLYIDMNNDAIVFNCVTPRIETGMIRVEGKLLMHSLSDMDFKLLLTDGLAMTFGLEGKINWLEDVPSKLLHVIIRTPMRQYHRIEFGLEYNEGDITHLKVFALPFYVSAEMFFGIESSVARAAIELQTQKDQVTKAEAVIPLNEFAPEFSAYLHGQEYKVMAKAIETEFGGNIALMTKNLSLFDIHGFDLAIRSKAPYEIDLDIDFKENTIGTNIMFDSSILVFAYSTILSGSSPIAFSYLGLI